LPPRAQINGYDATPTDARLRKSATILASCSRTVTSLLETFDAPGGKPRTKGSPKDTEQDVLRAMLLFAGAGLDSTIKQMMKDTIHDAIKGIHATREAFRKYIASKLTKRSAGAEVLDTHFLSSALAADDLHDELVRHFIRKWRSGSLQSAEELLNVAELYGISEQQVGFRRADLQVVFAARNAIAHEMDAEFTSTRSRHQRSRAEMVKHSNVLIDVTAKLLDLVEASLAP
jgi:hypothetical protein